MLISEKLAEMMNAQIGAELAASNQYLQIAAYFDSEVLPAATEFFFSQALEERDHAMKILHYILEAGGKLTIPDIAAPGVDFGSAEEAVKAALDWELEVTAQINALMDRAIEENDHIAQEFLRWFVNEQLEEVSTMDSLLTVARRVGDNLDLLEQYIRGTGHPVAAEA